MLNISINVNKSNTSAIVADTKPPISVENIGVRDLVDILLNVENKRPSDAIEYRTRGNGNKDPIILDVRPVTAPSVTENNKKRDKICS